MKSVKDVLAKVKGEEKVGETIPGKGSFSKSGFADLTHAMVNDTKHKFTYLGKDGKKVEVNVSELIRADNKKSLANAKYPQKSEAAVLDSSEIATAGLAEAIPYIIMEHLSSGKKFSLPAKENVNGDIYLAAVAGKTRTIPVRDIKTKKELGTTTITTKDSVQVRAKSPVPKHLQTKVRRDTTGKIVQ